MPHDCRGHMGAISFVSCEGASLREEIFWHATHYCVTLRASLMVPGQNKPWHMTFEARALGSTSNHKILYGLCGGFPCLRHG